MARREDESKLGTFNTTVATISSAVRTALATLVVGVLGVGSYVGYQTYNAKDIAAQRAAKERDAAALERDAAKASLSIANEQLIKKEEQLVSLNLEVAEKAKEIEKLATFLTLLKVDHRLARLTVVDQGIDENTKADYTDIEFVELNDEHQPVEQPRKFRIQGDVVFIDNWIVKFDDKYIEEADLDRSTSLVLFRRIFGEMQQPKDGYPLDMIGERPAAYAAGRKEMTEFEKKIWSDFWNIANDEKKAAELGIRAAHGEAVSIRVQPGKTYEIKLRASDGLSIAPEKEKPAE